jgi:hypothetical protein
MNKLKQTTETGLKDNFTIATTKTFQIDMDKALKSMELSEVMKVFIAYDINLKPEVKEFLEGYNGMMEAWQKPNKGSIVVNEVSTSGSRCIVCEYGKGMTVYEFHYMHSKAEIPLNRVIYRYDFGMMYYIQDGILNDLMICNAFLSKTDIKALHQKEL